MTTNNHPAHGPVSLDRLHQIRETLSKASAQSDGGNLGYAMADAVQVIDGVITARDAEPVAVNDDMAYAFHHALSDSSLGTDEVEEIKTGLRAAFANVTAPPAPVVPDEMVNNIDNPYGDEDLIYEEGKIEGWNACRADMLQAGNSPVTPDDVRRMDWLVSKTIDVREPMVYGSHSIFWSQTITDEDDDYHATKLREQIDAAMAAEHRSMR